MKWQFMAAVLVGAGILSACSNEPPECKSLIQSTVDKINAQRDATNDPSARLLLSSQIDDLKAKFQAIYDDASISKQTKADMCKMVASENDAEENKEKQEKQAAESYKKNHGNVETFVSTDAGNGMVNIRTKANQTVSFDVQRFADTEGKLAACKVQEPCKIVMRVEGTKVLDIVSAAPIGASELSEVLVPAPTFANPAPQEKSFRIVGMIQQGSDTSDIVASDGKGLTFITQSAMGTTILNACPPDSKCVISGTSDGNNIQTLVSAQGM